MAEPKGLSGYGTTYEVEDAPGSGVFVKLAKLRKVSKPSSTRAEIDASHMESEDETEEYISGMKNLGSIPLELIWIPNSTTDQFIEAWDAAGENRANRITYPNGVTDTFDGFVNQYTGEVPLKDLMTAGLTVRVAGAKQRGAAA